MLFRSSINVVTFCGLTGSTPDMNRFSSGSLPVWPHSGSHPGCVGLFVGKSGSLYHPADSGHALELYANEGMRTGGRVPTDLDGAEAALDAALV